MQISLDSWLQAISTTVLAVLAIWAGFFSEAGDLAIQRLQSDLSTTHTFTGTPSVKIVENHDGRAFIKQRAAQAIPAVQVGVTLPIAGPSP